MAPITHYPPQTRAAIEIPLRVKQHLGLDDDRSWIILDDLNQFKWPGYDLKLVPRAPGKIDYGFLPPDFYKIVVKKMIEIYRAAKFRPTLRND